MNNSVRNKCIRQNWKVFNKITFRPIDLEQPDNLEDINKWAEQVYTHVTEDELTRKVIYVRKGKKGYTISIWTDGDKVYLVQVIRSEWNTDETTIIAAPLTEGNLNDFLAIAKMVHKNIREFVHKSVINVQEFNKLAAIQEEMTPDKPDGQA